MGNNLSSFTAEHIDGPNGEKWYKVNDVVCKTKEEAIVAINKAIKEMWEVFPDNNEQEQEDNSTVRPRPRAR